jgi:hypothetical protein
MIRRSFLLPTKFEFVLTLQTADTFGVKARQACSPLSTGLWTGGLIP